MPEEENELGQEVIQEQETDLESEGDTGSPPEAEAEVKSEQLQLDKDLQQEQQRRANVERQVDQLRRELDDAKQPPADSEEEELDPLETIEQLKQKSKSYDELIARMDSMETEKVFDTFFSKMNSEHGKEFENDARKFATDAAIAEGFTLRDGDVPTNRETCLMLEKGYLLAKLQAGDKKSSTGKPVRQAIKHDTGRRGSSVSTASAVSGTPEEVRAAMVKEGRFKDYNLEE